MTRARTKALLLAGGLLAGALAAEAAVRAVEPAPYRGAEIRMSDGRVASLSEIIGVARGGPESRAASHPSGTIPPGTHFKVWYDRPKGPQFDRDGCIDVVANHLGFRDLEFDADKKPGELRVLAIGDSFTIGHGVRLEDAWPQVLERLIRDRIGAPVEVINGGFAAGSHWPAGYVDWIERDAFALHPDLLVIGFTLNDMHTDVPLLAYEAAREAPWLGGASHFLNAIQRAIAQRRAVKSHPKDFAEIVRRDPMPWEQNQAALRRIRDLCREHGVDFAVAVFPMLSLLDGDYPYLELHRMVDAFCAAEGIPCVDLLDRFRGEPEGSLWVHPTDQHPNIEGLRRFAEGIDAFLKPTVDARARSIRATR
ncbi:MAG TPA: SGNH/GDSL hydrolase family protein [Planctomycetota bacterium]|nr:SGNH/GDSL hydrolase family protein [Planctomycetota bacterium]